MLVFPQFWMSLKILDEAAKNHTLRIWSAGRTERSTSSNSFLLASNWCFFKQIIWHRCFLKWWYPQIIHFNGIFHYKPSILGYRYFRKPPYTHQKRTFLRSQKKVKKKHRFRFRSSKSFPPASINEIYFFFTKLMILTDPTFLGASNRKVMDILLIENHSLTLEIPNLWEAIPRSSFLNGALGEILKLQRTKASFLSCSNQLWILLETAFIHKCLENWDPKNKKDSQLFLHFKRLAKLLGIFCLDFSWSWATGS